MITRQFIHFLLASGLAAAANFLSRLAFSLFVPYAVAIVMAFFVGLLSAFVLNRTFVFKQATTRLHQQALWFVLVNLAALVQTLAISLLLARWLFPTTGMDFHPESVAHAIGIIAPTVTSYIGHKRLTFRTARDRGPGGP